MATRSNDHLQDEEPLRKKARFSAENKDVCIDLKKLMSYDEIESTIVSKSMPANEDAGDSGFQDEYENNSPLSLKSYSNSCSSIEQNQTTFISSTENENQFKSNHFSQKPEKLEQQDSSNDSESNFYQKNQINLIPKNLNDDNESLASEISCFDSLSDLEDVEDWQKPSFGPVDWVQRQITSGTNPRQIIDGLLPNNFISNKYDNLTLWKFIFNMLSEPPRRKKLEHVNNLDDVVSLIKKSKKIIILTGAGISVSAGIPDFRSKDGIYARLSIDFPDLPDPQAMFDINYFKKDQRPFFKFAKEIYPGQFKPSISHKFIKLIENHGKLLRNYTQNIDTLEKSANIENVLTCHGSFATATCTNCKYKVDGSQIKDDIFAQRIPLCPKCSNNTNTDAMCVMKPDIVFFGEGLPEEFHDSMDKDKNECDLLIVIGSSLKVKPVALIPTSIPAHVPQILINREHLSHMTFDVELLGDSDIIIEELCHRLGDGFNDICLNKKLNEVKDFNFEEICNKMNSDKLNDNSADSVPNENLSKPNFSEILPEGSFIFVPPARYLFKGAEVDSDSSDSESECSSDEDDEEINDSQNNSNSSTIDHLDIKDFNDKLENKITEELNNKNLENIYNLDNLNNLDCLDDLNDNLNNLENNLNNNLNKSNDENQTDKILEKLDDKSSLKIENQADKLNFSNSLSTIDKNNNS